MAVIIQMQPRMRGESKPAPPTSGGAQILFFLGVRYMHAEEPPPATGGAPKGAESGGKGRRRRARA